MAAMFRRQRPGGGRHPPPLAPSVSSFKPRAQWNNSGSSIFLYVNLPGFYMDQIEIKKDERTRTIQIQGQRPLSSQTKARFNEAYRVPETCDMTKLSTTFSHGLLTIEFPAVVKGEKQEKAVQDQGKTVQEPSHEVSTGHGSSLGQKKPLGEEKKVGTSQEKAAKEEEPKTYKSVVEGKRAVPTSSQQKVKEGEASPSLGGKGRAKEEKVIERKESAQMGQHKTVQKLKEEEARSTPTIGSRLKPTLRAKEEKVVERKEAAQVSQQKTLEKLKEEEARSTPTIGGSLKPTVRAKEEKVIERKKDADISQTKTVQKEKVKKKEISRTSIVDGSLEPKVHTKAEKVSERKGDGEIGQKLKEEVKIGLDQKKEDKYTKPVVGDDEARKTAKDFAATNRAEPEPKTKEGVETSKHDKKEDEKKIGEKVSGGEIEERVEESGLGKETGDVKDNEQVRKPKKIDLDNPMKEESSREGEDRDKIVEKGLESETSPLLVQGQKTTDMEEKEESQKSDLSLVNVGVAALVIMGFGAYIFLPLLK